MLTIRRVVCIVSLFWALGSGVSACRPAATPAERPQAAVGPAVVTQPPAPPGRPEIGFRSPTRLAEHFRKHGAEFEGFTQADYLRAAQQLRDAPVGGDVLEVVRPDGTISRFDRRSSAFLAFDPDGTIRTFFRPNDGEAYFRRQARRSQR